jgi:hypothetical protein
MLKPYLFFSALVSRGNQSNLTLHNFYAGKASFAFVIPFAPVSIP